MIQEFIRIKYNFIIAYLNYALVIQSPFFFNLCQAGEEITAKTRWKTHVLGVIRLSHHSVRFARARLTIRKHADVVALQCVFQCLNAYLFVDFALRCELRVGRLERW